MQMLEQRMAYGTTSAAAYGALPNTLTHGQTKAAYGQTAAMPSWRALPGKLYTRAVRRAVL